MNARRNFISGALSMGLLDFLGLAKTASATPEEAVQLKPPHWPQGAIAQLVGASLITPLNDPGYGLDHHLPKYLELGPDDEAPKTYKGLTPKGGVRYRFDDNLLEEVTTSFSFTVTYYNQDVQGYHQFLWNGVRMKQLAIVAGFTVERTQEEAWNLWRGAYLSFGENTRPGSFTLASGNSGWTTLETAWQTIATPEAKVTWLATVDSPSWPEYKFPNEAAVLLMVAHPGFESGREPLAYFTAPAVVPVKGLERVKGESPRTTALRLAVEQACATAGIAPAAIGTVARDCGRHSKEAAVRLAETSAALLPLLPEYDIVHQGIDLAAVFGELGANTVSYTLLLAAYAANQRRHPVLYISSRDPDAGRAMLVLPTPNPVPPADPERLNRVARSRGQWYRPWWGQRLDGKKDF